MLPIDPRCLNFALPEVVGFNRRSNNLLDHFHEESVFTFPTTEGPCGCNSQGSIRDKATFAN
jgi:hypothetical protein